MSRKPRRSLALSSIRVSLRSPAWRRGGALGSWRQRAWLDLEPVYQGGKAGSGGSKSGVMDELRLVVSDPDVI